MSVPDLTRYDIIETIGAGGMGVVYLAHDRRLERRVALKVLPSGILLDERRRERFRREALALSRLNHPNIATIYDFDSEGGIDFLVMEYVPGRTLDAVLRDGPLPVPRLLPLAEQLAAGLAAAHGHEIVHADLKPANLRLTPDGQLKILDFGLATFVQPSSATAMTVTLESGPSGTMPYLAPEQVRQERIDPRTDLHAAGAVLYEAATGRRPFQAEQAAALLFKIVNDEPTPPREIDDTIPASFETVIMKLMAKRPEDRYQNTAGLAADLERFRQGEALTARRRVRRRVWLPAAVVLLVAATLLVFDVGGLRRTIFAPRPGGTAIAVLPCIDLGGNADHDYLVDGMTDDLIVRMSGIASFSRVISTTTMLRYRGTGKSLADIASELGVQVLLASRLRFDRDDLHLSAQLIAAKTEEVLWADQYVARMQDVYRLQADVTRGVTAALGLSLTGDERKRLGDTPTVDPEAYRALMRGMELRRAPGGGGAWRVAEQRSVQCFRQAAEIDPAYARALFELWWVSHALSDPHYWDLPDEDELRAKTAFYAALADSARAVATALDPDMAELYPVVYDPESFRRIIARRPSDAWAYYWHTFWLRTHGRMEEARAMHERAMDLDPGNLRFQSVYAQYFYGQHDFRRAEAICREVLTVTPTDSNALQYLWFSLMEERRFAEAQEAMEAYARVKYPSLGSDLSFTDPLYAAMEGEEPVSDRTWSIVDGLVRRFGGQLGAYFSIYLGEPERAIAYLEQAWSGPHPLDWAKRPVGPNMLNMPTWDPIREDPRIVKLAEHLEEVWRRDHEDQ